MVKNSIGALLIVADQIGALFGGGNYIGVHFFSATLFGGDNSV